jgi:glycosyltransferase involved in cell wall biosynthesis
MTAVLRKKAKKIAIIASYKEECGIAFHAERLEQNYRAHSTHQVAVLALNLQLLRAESAQAQKQADAHLRDLCTRMQDYDAVIIQYEPGLLSYNFKLSYARYLQLLRSHHNIILTIHSFFKFKAIKNPLSLAKLLLRGKLRALLANMFHAYRDRATANFWQQVAALAHVKIQAQNINDAQLLANMCGAQQVTDFPVTYYTQTDIERFKQIYNKMSFCKHYGLNPEYKYILIYGFIAPYKGHLTAIKMLAHLPPDYHLVIVGGQHPYDIAAGKQLDDYLAALLYMLTPATEREAIKSNLSLEHDLYKVGEIAAERVHFLGQLHDDAMLEVYAGIDYVILPYINPLHPQSASGPATYALEFNCRTLFSNAQVFKYLAHYYPQAMKFCNVGNYLEFAQAIISYDNFYPEITRYQSQACERYNPQTLINFYDQLFGFATAKPHSTAPAALNVIG